MINIPVVCVIEEKIKVFDIIKNILAANNGDKNIFLYGNADFSADIKKHLDENGAIIFRRVNPAGFETDIGEIIDLAVLGEFEKNIDIAKLGSIKSVLLNIDNSCAVKSLNKSDKAMQIVTCGLKEKDTAIFSSINFDEGSVILDLQRSIKDINGETLEPFEKQINLSEIIDNIKKEPPKHAGFTTEDLILALSALMFCGRV